MRADEIRKSKTELQGVLSTAKNQDELRLLLISAQTDYLGEVAAQLAELNENFNIPKGDTRTIAEVTTPKQYIIAKINETRGMFVTDSDVYEDLDEAQRAVRTHTAVSPGYKVYEIREVQP